MLLSRKEFLECLVGLESLRFDANPILDENGSIARNSKGDILYDLTNEPTFDIKHWISGNIRKLKILREELAEYRSLPPELEERRKELEKVIREHVDERCHKNDKDKPIKTKNGDPAKVVDGKPVLDKNGENVPDTDLILEINEEIRKLENEQFPDVMEAVKKKDEEIEPWTNEKVEIPVSTIPLDKLLKYRISGNILWIHPLIEE